MVLAKLIVGTGDACSCKPPYQGRIDATLTSSDKPYKTNFVTLQRSAASRGVARNLLRGQTRGVWGT